MASLPTDPHHSYTNALIHEKSPYLLQHAHNPVNWQAWSDEAFEQARREDKPIFLSIGYATCHWCHVMERESFENTDIADFLNQHYISIKVDREERPDIDAIYMSVCQALTGQGGWPLTIFMDADKQPFFAGTYFPPENHAQRPGFPYLIQHIEHSWRTEREKITESSAAILEHLAPKNKGQENKEQAPTSKEHSAKSKGKGTKKQKNTTASSNHLLDHKIINSLLSQAFARYEQVFDPQFGGFAAQPKFPSPQNLLLLLRHFKRTGEKAALAMVERTVLSMRKGGIFDQLGYGFHRYSTDREWLVPHFEKMLYDQAMMALVCLETFQITKNEAYSRIAEEIFNYVLRDMTDDDGAFYSAEDADSEGHEGTFYIWTSKEIREVLGDEDGRLFAAFYNCTEEGNFEEEATRERTGENIPHVRLSEEDFAHAHGIDAKELRARLSIFRERLFMHREERVRPLKDDKILTDWNGLMIAAFALGGRVFDNAFYTQVAERALSFFQQKMFVSVPSSSANAAEMPRLLHRYRAGDAAIPAFLDDYAFLAWGALELYQTHFQIKHLKSALFLADEMLRLFENTDEGGFYFSASDNETLIFRTQEGYDGAIPSGNSVAASVLARLGKLTNRAHYIRSAERTIAYFAESMQRYPTGFAQMLIAADFLTHSTQEIILAGGASHPATYDILRLLAETFLPYSVVAYNHTPHELKEWIEQAEYQTSHNGVPMLYICENYQCRMPLDDIAAIRTVLGV
ncbi:MAG: thioredoxin domain-containing protein [Candidatus Kapaibacterium sp.]|nr:MAG: thioredoxin domain-containing protein [Candidatus Kapabacteria bacterium]